MEGLVEPVQLVTSPQAASPWVGRSRSSREFSSGFLSRALTTELLEGEDLAQDLARSWPWLRV